MLHMTNILDFSDEILCEVFEYLSPFDALYSFLNLNERFNRLLIPFKHQIDLTYLSYEQFMYYVNNILPILSQDGKLNRIKLGNNRTPGQIRLFNQLIDDEKYRDYFNKIDRILLESPCLQELTDFVGKYLLSLTNLQTLLIKFDNIRDKDFQELNKLLTNSILPIQTLTEISLQMSGLVLSRLSNTIAFPSLVYVNLNLSLITDLLILIPRIPNVKTLLIGINWWSSRDQTIVRLLDEMRSNNNQRSSLNYLKKFQLKINSIIQFQFEQFEEILSRIINNQITSNFSLILQNNITINDQTNKLIDGQQWQRVLSVYPSLIYFDLVIIINTYGHNKEDIIQLKSFDSKYFQDRKWFFSYLKYSINDSIILYSIPYRYKQSFDIIINDNILFNDFPINHTPILSINNKNNREYRLTLDFILKHFPSLQELTLINIDTNIPPVNSIEIPSLHTLKIEKEYDINSPNLFRLFPLINTLFLLYCNTDDQNNLSSIHQYDRIIELSLRGISEANINQISVFLNQFTNLRYLYIYIQNRRINDEILLLNLNRIVQVSSSLISLKIQLDKELKFLANPHDQLNTRLKMYLTDLTFDGVLVHLWF